MLKSSATYSAPNYSHVIHLPEGTTSVSPQLNYISDTVLKVKVELAKTKIEVKELKNQLFVIYLSLVNEIKHSGKSTLSVNTSF